MFFLWHQEWRRPSLLTHSELTEDAVLCSVKLGLAVEVLPFLRGPERRPGLAQLEGAGVQAGVQRCRLPHLSAFTGPASFPTVAGRLASGRAHRWFPHKCKTNALSQSNLGLEGWTQVQRPGWLPFLPCGNMACPKGMHTLLSFTQSCLRWTLENDALVPSWAGFLRQSSARGLHSPYKQGC